MSSENQFLMIDTPLHHFYAALAPAPTLLFSKAKFLKPAKV
jgi:hypothetical protein